jgi:hypothetical protein
MKRHERRWGRSRARDEYDLRSILKNYRDNINLTLLPEMVQKNGPPKE